MKFFNKNKSFKISKPSIKSLISYYEGFEKRDRQEIYERNALIGSIKLSLLYLISNIFTFLLFFFAARRLGVEEYSLLGVLLSIFFMFAIATSLMNIVIIKFLSYFIAKSQYDKLSNFCNLFIRMMVLSGFILFVIFIIFSKDIAFLLKIYRPSNVIALGILIWTFI